MTTEKIKHLEFVQNVITRMNKNSFQIKGWMITIVSALLALFASSNNETFIWIGIGPTVMFWLLDAYYLQQERKFRGVYNDIAEITSQDKRLIIKDFEMPIYKYKSGKYCYFNVLTSMTIIGIYMPVILALVIVGIIV